MHRPALCRVTYQRYPFIDIWAARTIVDAARVRIHPVAGQVISVHYNDVIIIQATAF